MAVFKMKSGKWKAKINYRNSSGKIITKEKVFERKIDAQNFQTDFKRALKTNMHDLDSITYEEIFRSYIDSSKLKTTEKTTKEKIYFANEFWKHMMDKRYIEISKRDWMKVYNKLITRNYSTGYKNKIIICIKSIAKFAYKYYDLPDNTKTLDLLQNRKKIEHNFWGISELNNVLDEMKDTTTRLLIKTLFYTGARREELRLLTKSEYNKSTRTIYFKNNVYRTLKTPSSERKLKIHKELADELIPLIEAEGEFLFGGIEPVSKTTLSRYFENAITKSGVKRIRLHDLRHSHATILINEGANIVAVSKRLGHSNTNQTLQTYTHLMQKSDDELMEILGNL